MTLLSMWKPHSSGVTHILSCLPFLVSSLGFVVRKLTELNIFNTLINQDKNILNAVFQWIQFIYSGIPALSASCLHSVFIEFDTFIEYDNVANKMSSRLCVKLTKTYFLKVPIMENFQHQREQYKWTSHPQTLHIWPVPPHPHIHLRLPFILIFLLTLFEASIRYPFIHKSFPLCVSKR